MVLGELVVPKPVTDWLRAALRTTDTTQVKAREDALQHAQGELQRIEARIETMYLDKLDGRITVAFFDEKAASWRAEQAKLQARINELRQQTANYEDAINVVEQTSNLWKEFPTQCKRAATTSHPIIHTATWKDTSSKPPSKRHSRNYDIRTP